MFGITGSSFKTCKSINDIVNDIDVQTFDDLEMSKRMSADRENTFNYKDNNGNKSPLAPSHKHEFKDKSHFKSPGFKVKYDEDIDFDQVNEQSQSPLIKNINNLNDINNNHNSIQNLKFK